MAFFLWSRTAASNGTADPSAPFPEGMAPSAVNDSARGMMAGLAMYRDDVAGAIVTTGTNASYLVTSYSGFDSAAHMNGQTIAFSPHTVNVDTVVLTVDGLGPYPLRSSPGVELVAGTLIQGTPYAALFNSTTGEFYLKGAGNGNPYNVPFLAGLDFWDTIAPNSRFIFPAGQAISRTVYSAAFARWGTTYGSGDGSTTFNVPDKTGRVSAMIEGTSTRLPATYFTGTSTAMGAVGGAPDQTLALGHLPANITAAGTVTIFPNGNGGLHVPYSSSAWSQGIYAGGSNNTPTTGGSIGDVTSWSGANTLTSNNTGLNASGGAKNVPTIQPTIVCNYILRII